MVRSRIWVLVVAALVVGSVAVVAATRQGTVDASPADTDAIDIDRIRSEIFGDVFAIEKAASPLIIECMKQKGFTAVARDRGLPIMPAGLGPEEHSAWKSAWTAGPSVTRTGLGGRRTSYSTGGCLNEARDIAAGGSGAWIDIFEAMAEVNAFAAVVDSFATSDSGYQRAEQRWSACMKGAGYDARTRDEFLGSGRTPAADDAHERCAVSSGLSEALNDALRRHGPKAREMVQPAIEMWRQVRQFGAADLPRVS